MLCRQKITSVTSIYTRRETRLHGESEGWRRPEVPRPSRGIHGQNATVPGCSVSPLAATRR
jgi:hypothetical protein